MHWTDFFADGGRPAKYWYVNVGVAALLTWWHFSNR